MRPQQVETPDATTIEGLAELLGVDEAATAKAMPVVAEGEVVLGLVRGDDRLHQLKMQKALKSDFRPATAEEIRSTFGAEPGSIGPVGVDVRVIADESLRDGQFVSGANVHRAPSARVSRPGATSRPSSTICARCPTARRARAAAPARCGWSGPSRSATSSSWARGTRRLLGATYLDESGTEHPIVMGSYGIGLARIMASAVEQSHDEKGIIWPAALAPFDVHMVVIGEPGVPQLEAAETIAAGLDARGLRVLVDDRDMGPGARFADAELIGIPARVTVGKRTASDGTADVQVRRGREQTSLAVADVPDAVVQALAER